MTDSLLVKFDNHYYAPVLKDYPETIFGGDFETAADYRDPTVQKLINAKGWVIWPPVRFSWGTINYNLPTLPLPHRRKKTG